jgi:hypothetical protein
VIGVSLYLRSFLTPAPDIAVTAGNELKAKVFYIDNDIFGGGERPAKLNYLMSYTDYIEVENTLSLEFDKEADVLFRYTADETLVIKYQRGSDNNTNPVVYEKQLMLAEKNGGARGGRILFDGGDAPGGVYVVELKKYIDIYKDFIIDQQAQMRREDVLTERAVNFSADLIINVSCNIRVAEYGINRTLERSAVIPLTLEVFDIQFSGNPSVDLTVPAQGRESGKLNRMAVILLVLWFVANVYGIAFCSRRLMVKKHPHTSLREAETILKKYSDEIVISKNPVDLSGYKTIETENFKDLLKLAVILNKHILCRRDGKDAAFYVTGEGCVYWYKTPSF